MHQCATLQKRRFPGCIGGWPIGASVRRPQLLLVARHSLAAIVDSSYVAVLVLHTPLLHPHRAAAMLRNLRPLLAKAPVASASARPIAPLARSMASAATDKPLPVHSRSVEE